MGAQLWQPEPITSNTRKHFEQLALDADRRTNLTNLTVSSQGVVNGHVFPDANPLRRTEMRRSRFMIVIMIMRREITYHSSFSILRTTTCVSRVMIPVGPQ